MSDHPEWNCPNCRECESCDGGSGVTPKRYRLIPFPGGKVLGVRCADCEGEGLTCLCGCHSPVSDEPAR